MNQQELEAKLETIKDKLITIDRKSDKRIFLHCESQNSFEVNRFLFQDVKARFVIATAVDNEDTFEIVYHYSYDQTGCVINIKAFIRDREHPAVESITPIIPGAEWIEREMHDIMGIDFINHPNLKRLVLCDDWPQGVYPLRKEVKK